MQAGRPGPGNEPDRRPGFTFDLNAPHGEPHRIFFYSRRRRVTIGLLSFQEFRETGRRTALNGRGTAIDGEWHRNWLHPHCTGISRYRYHEDENGKWVRNDKPEPMHWGWLTIEKVQ